MLVYSLKRILGSIPTLFAIIAISFFMMRLTPGGPFDTEQPLQPEIRENLMKAYGLDQPLWKQFVNYMGNILQGDFGTSFKQPDWTVNELIVRGFPASLKLGLWAISLALLLGITFGSLAALRQNTWVDYSVMGTAMVGITIPNFVIAPLLSLTVVFAIEFCNKYGISTRFLPAVSGSGDGGLKYMLLPVLSLALPQIAYISRLTRGSMIEVLRSNFIRTARAKGLSERIIVVRHALRAALLPVISYLGPATANIITGSVVIEKIFQIQGIGSFFVTGALNRDYTLVMGIVVFFGIIIIIFNLLVDLLYGFLDPRVRYD